MFSFLSLMSVNKPFSFCFRSRLENLINSHNRENSSGPLLWKTWESLKWVFVVIGLLAEIVFITFLLLAIRRQLKSRTNNGADVSKCAFQLNNEAHE